ncbi:MAG TPA: FAD-binding oxidoreductase [Solirubrobacteraceae bacterium]|nr:FAD-binding oxidoreductase [Solirubrobacteraceae bacterium]
MSTPQVVVSKVKAALVAALGEQPVSTDADDLDSYSADTYWPALAAAAAGTPLARPEIVVRPRTEEDVATVLAIADEHGTPVVPWGGGSGTQGGSLPTEGGIVIDLRSLDQVLEIDTTSMTVTAQAGVNGRRLEGELNDRGLMLPHYPASVEWATVGGYIAARGSGVLSTRYGKIEDLLLTLRVATPATGLIETVGVPRHAVGPELTQLFVGSEGTLGVITRATLQLVPMPEERRFAAVAFPSVSAGIHAIRRALQAGHRPSVVRMYDEDATRLAFSPVVGEELSGVYTVLAFEGDAAAVDAEERRTLEIAREAGGELLDPALGQRWWDRRYDFYHPPHQPELPAIWGTLDVVATYARIEKVYEALHHAIRVPYADTGLQLRMHFSHWYAWGTMIYGRFVVPDGGPDALALHDRIWEDGMTAALDAGGVMNDHHGVGIKLGPYMRRQHGGALDAMRQIKASLDPNNIMNPRKMGL